MVRPHAAALPPPCRITFCPGATAEITAIAAIGRRAAATAPFAFAMPAPHVLVVHEHSVF